MSKLVWHRVHADQLKRLRLAAGVEITTLAKRHSLSSAQIYQLEESGDSTFYSKEIKYTVGRKLIRSFGEEITEVDFEKQLTCNTLKQVQPLSQAIVLQPTLIASIEPLSQLSKRRWVAFIGIFLAIILAWYGQVGSTSPKQITDSDPTRFDTKGPNLMAQQREAQGSHIVSTYGEQPINLSVVQTSECDWSAHAVDLTPSSKFRPDHYTYLVATQSTVFCWKDSDHVNRKISLKLNESIKLEGQPPFHIYSVDFSNVKIYYLGNLIRPPNPGEKHIFLGKQ